MFKSFGFTTVGAAHLNGSLDGSGGSRAFRAVAATRQNAITNIQFATLPQIVWRTAANAVPLVACGNLFDLRTVNLAGNSTIF